jgi:hypothetical protein
MGGGQRKNTPLECMVKNFKRGFNGDYGVKLTPNKLKFLCKVDWSALGVGWPLEESLDKTLVNEAYRIVGKPGPPEQFPYTDCWQDAVLSWLTWLRPYLEEACRIMVAKVAATSMCREKTKEPILAREPEEAPPPYVLLFPPSPSASSSAPPLPTLDGETQGTVTPVKSDLEALRTSTPLNPKCYGLHIHFESAHTPHSIGNI